MLLLSYTRLLLSVTIKHRIKSNSTVGYILSVLATCFPGLVYLLKCSVTEYKVTERQVTYREYLELLFVVRLCIGYSVVLETK